MVPCKFQTDVTGSSLLVYSEDRNKVNATITNDPEVIKAVAFGLQMRARLGKCFAMAEMNAAGQLTIGDKLTDQGW